MKLRLLCPGTRSGFWGARKNETGARRKPRHGSSHLLGTRAVCGLQLLILKVGEGRPLVDAPVPPPDALGSHDKRLRKSTIHVWEPTFELPERARCWSNRWKNHLSKVSSGCLAAEFEREREAFCSTAAASESASIPLPHLGQPVASCVRLRLLHGGRVAIPRNLKKSGPAREKPALNSTSSSLSRKERSRG